MKVQYVIAALQAGKNKFTVSQLTDIIRADAGDKALERRTRRALFVARKAGIILEPVRDGGKAVSAYQLQGALPEVATPARKASKASSAKAVAKAKVTKGSLESAVRAINASHSAKEATVKRMAKEVVAKVKEVDVSRISNEAKAAIKAKNLETMKSVSARLHPVTKRPVTTEQATALDEFAEMEKQAELEEIRAEERAAMRANAPAFLFKESYSE
jgi:hypothetical protein